jgi:hypothetical protein
MVPYQPDSARKVQILEGPKVNPNANRGEFDCAFQELCRRYR